MPPKAERASEILCLHRPRRSGGSYRENICSHWQHLCDSCWSGLRSTMGRKLQRSAQVFDFRIWILATSEIYPQQMTCTESELAFPSFMTHCTSWGASSAPIQHGKEQTQTSIATTRADLPSTVQRHVETTFTSLTSGESAFCQHHYTPLTATSSAPVSQQKWWESNSASTGLPEAGWVESRLTAQTSGHLDRS